MLEPPGTHLMLQIHSVCSVHRGISHLRRASAEALVSLQSGTEVGGEDLEVILASQAAASRRHAALEDVLDSSEGQVAAVEGTGTSDLAGFTAARERLSVIMEEVSSELHIVAGVRALGSSIARVDQDHISSSGFCYIRDFKYKQRKCEL